MKRFSGRAREQLKHYVYLYVDPRDKKPFYVGKGKGNRVFSHETGKGQSAKARKIHELLKLGLTPEKHILRYGLTKAQAFDLESAAIDILGLSQLTNAVRGHDSQKGTWGTAEEIAAMLGGKAAEVRVPGILINVSRAFRAGMSPQELYDATRSAWRIVQSRAENADYAFCVYNKIIREVYTVAAWAPGGTTMRSSDTDGRQKRRPKRIEFVGQVAPEVIRRKYIGRSVERYFSKGARNPIHYVRC